MAIIYPSNRGLTSSRQMMSCYIHFKLDLHFQCQLSCSGTLIYLLLLGLFTVWSIHHTATHWRTLTEDTIESDLYSRATLSPNDMRIICSAIFCALVEQNKIKWVNKPHSPGDSQTRSVNLSSFNGRAPTCPSLSLSAEGQLIAFP